MISNRTPNRVALALTKPLPKLLAIMLISSVFGTTAAGSAAPAPSPASGWAGQVGIQGGIPSYTMFVNARSGEMGSGSTYKGPLAKGDGTTDDAPALQAMINSCPNSQFVYLPAGIYRLNSGLLIKGQDIVYDNLQHPVSKAIKGDGPAATRIFLYGPGPAISISPYAQIGARQMGIAGGGSRGLQVLTLTSIDAYLKAPMPVLIKRKNSEAISAAYPNTMTPSYMEAAASQLVKVTSVNEATKTITIEPGLNEGYASDTLEIGINVPIRCGVQDLYIENMTNNGSHNIAINFGMECWVKNVESVMASKWHIRLTACLRSEVRQCYVHDGWNAGGDGDYGVGLYQWSSNNLVEDNIAVRCRHSYITEYGGQGNVIAYNYSKDPINEMGLATDYLMGDLTHHGGSPRYNLWEGNVGATITVDSNLGGSNMNTFYRNRIQRKGLPTTYVACFGSDIQKWSYQTTLIGNIYELPPDRYNPTQYGTRRWGTFQDDNSKIDPESQATAYLDGEYDASTGLTLWVNGTHDLTPSKYLNTAPSFFGTMSWPPFDSRSPTASSATSLPAAARYLSPSKPKILSIQVQVQ